VARAVPGGPDQNHHATFNVSDRDRPRLAIVAALVIRLLDRRLEHLGRAGEVEAAVLQRLLALGFVERDQHRRRLARPS
jgi:hypothetical protein